MPRDSESRTSLAALGTLRQERTVERRAAERSYGPRAMMVESDYELRRGLRWGGGAQAARKRRVEGEETSGGRPRKVSKESRHAGKTTRRGSYLDYDDERDASRGQ